MPGASSTPAQAVVPVAWHAPAPPGGLPPLITEVAAAAGPGLPHPLGPRFTQDSIGAALGPSLSCPVSAASRSMSSLRTRHSSVAGLGNQESATGSPPCASHHRPGFHGSAVVQTVRPSDPSAPLPSAGAAETTQAPPSAPLPPGGEPGALDLTTLPVSVLLRV